LNNLLKRAITGAIFVAVIVGAILWSPYSFAVVFAVIAALMLAEFYHLMNRYQGVEIALAPQIAGGVILFLGMSTVVMGLMPQAILLLYLAYLMTVFIAELYGKRKQPIRNWAYIIMGQVYIVLPLSLLCLVGFRNEVYEPTLLLGLFISIWLNDTGAYLVGSRIGKHRLFPRISPKKSWEGFWGGICFAMIGGFLLSRFSTALTTAEWIAFGAFVAVFSTWGDLTESLIKRTIEVKDSGTMLPGHGGMLDRFDSVLLACPAALIFLELLDLM
jgi:phosphatidate cytidylyltransferase